jgi:hypothetical protein
VSENNRLNGTPPTDFALWKAYATPSRSGVVTLLLLVVMQLSYSIAPVFLSRAIQSETRPYIVGFAIAYIAFNYLPYPLTFLIQQFRVRWAVDVRSEIAEKAANSYSGRLHLAGSQQAEQSYVALATNNSQSIVSGIVDYIYSFISTLASSSITLLVMAIYADGAVFVAYASSLALLCITIVKTKSKQKELSQGQEAAYNEVLAAIAGSWIAVVLSQLPFVQLAKEKKERLWRVYRDASTRSNAYFQRVSMVQSVVIWAPMGAAVAWVLLTRSHTAVIAFIPFLPRVIELLLDISHMAMALVSFGAQTGKLRWLDEQFTSSINTDYEARIDAAKIVVARDHRPDETLREIGEIDGLLRMASQSRRIKIRGTNGSGKSTLLRALKKHFGDEALLIDASASQFVAPGGLSTGERKMVELDLAFAFLRNEKLVQLSTRAVVIEVVHHISMHVAQHASTTESSALA